ncbi:hypothetical protein DID97_13435 [Burkholderia sp. Bp8977]|nr:hypothetical protein DIE10_10595 [Burkholderia sp. Bp9011]RQR94798.1 hypothetical protein DIE09_10780 [Burkholderia sp. Bp9010]RQS77101.1 hypothetical protein DID97_13435 [Burkholderia sp. Bp8977]
MIPSKRVFVLMVRSRRIFRYPFPAFSRFWVIRLVTRKVVPNWLHRGPIVVVMLSGRVQVFVAITRTKIVILMESMHGLASGEETFPKR